MHLKASERLKRESHRASNGTGLGAACTRRPHFRETPITGTNEPRDRKRRRTSRDSRAAVVSTLTLAIAASQREAELAVAAVQSDAAIARQLAISAWQETAKALTSLASVKANLRACLARQGPDTVGNPNARPLAHSSVPGTPTTSNYGSTNQQPSYRATTHGPGKSTYQSAMASVLMDTPVAGSEQQRGSSPEPSRDTVPAGQQQCPSEHRALTSTRDRGTD